MRIGYFMVLALAGAAVLVPGRVLGESADALYDKGMAAVKEGRLDDAKSALEEDLRLQPNNDAVETALARVLRDQQDYAGAISHFEQVAARRPDDPRAQGELGYCYDKAGRGPEALAPLEKAAAREPDEPLWHALLGNLYRQAKQYDKEVTQQESMVRLEPGSVTALHSLASALMRNGESERAIKTYKKVTKSDPKRADAWRDLGMLLASKERKAEAVTALNRYLDLTNPHRKGVQEVRDKITALGGTPH